MTFRKGFNEFVKKHVGKVSPKLANILTKEINFPRVPVGATIATGLTAIVLSLTAGCKSVPSDRKYLSQEVPANWSIAVKGESNEKYRELSEILKGAMKVSTNNSIDFYAQHGNSAYERQGMPDLNQDFWKVNAGVNQAINLGNKAWLIPGADFTYRNVDYSGGNSPNNKNVSMPGVRLRIKSPTLNGFFRYRGGSGEFEFNGLKDGYRERNIFGEAYVNLGDGWRVGAGAEQWQTTYAGVGKVEQREGILYFGKQLKFPFADDVYFGLTTKDTNYNPGTNYDTAVGAALKIKKKLTDNLELEVGGQYWPKSDKYNTPGSGGSIQLKIKF